MALDDRERHRVEQLHVGRICGGSVIRAGVSQLLTVEVDSRGRILAAAAAGTAGGKNVRNGSFMPP